ncbi:hypothetical protein [Brevibacillus choshinensis]|uniref:Uncharacterized protein n=1 Tax=Brevibacillus choshinensis TaxID=54911 RepID=A0ABX7FIB7_BRECH|nr:hypothetical protein [Brevibacillus choshinensis]QRG65345.1 hypothetical protein JNE38_17105 [Brevibacillus choshinensis]
MRWRWMLLLAAVWLTLGVRPVQAESNMEIDVDVPLGGIIKYNAWTRLEVSVTAQDIPFHGYVELSKRKSSKGSHESALRQQIDLEPGKNTVVNFDLPAQVLLDEWYIRLSQNGQVIQAEKLRMPYPKDGQTIGIIHEGASAFHFLAIQQSQMTMGMPYSIQNLNVESLPSESWIYQNLDVLALGGKQASQLQKEQVLAIEEWVKTGGFLILSAGPGQDDVVKPFQKELPVAAGHSGQMSLSRGLQAYTGEKVIPEGQIAVYNRDLPLFTSKAVGAGRILFVNYDVTAEPLASWQYNSQLWQNVLERHGGLQILEQHTYVDQMIRPFLELSRQIPGVQTPAPIWMVVLWGGYVLVVAPLTYFVLKRKERRQWAWGIIPGFAVLLTFGTFAVGKPLVVKSSASYTISDVRIVDDQLAQVKTASTFLAVDRDQYDVQVEEPLVALPLALGKNDYEPEGITDGKKISYRNVSYLTPKQAIGFGMLPDAGQFTASLTVNGDHLQGKVRNNTRFALESSFLEVGLQRIPLGAMTIGEEKQVDIRLDPLFMPRQSAAGNKETTSEERRKQMQESVLTYSRGHEVRVLGVNTQELPLLTMQEPHQSQYWNVIHQTIPLGPDSRGIITYPYGLLDVVVRETSGDYDSNSAYLWELGKGSITFELEAGEAKLDLERVIVPLEHSSFRPFRIEVFEQKTGRWLPLERGKRLMLDKELAQMLTPRGTLLLRFSHDGTPRLTLPTPFYQVEGRERTW